MGERIDQERPADARTDATISCAEKRDDVEVTTLMTSMVELEPSDNSADEKQHSLLPEVPLGFSEVADMVV